MVLKRHQKGPIGKHNGILCFQIQVTRYDVVWFMKGSPPIRGPCDIYSGPSLACLCPLPFTGYQVKRSSEQAVGEINCDGLMVVCTARPAGLIRPGSPAIFLSVNKETVFDAFRRS